MLKRASRIIVVIQNSILEQATALFVPSGLAAKPTCTQDSTIVVRWKEIGNPKTEIQGTAKDGFVLVL